jgi:hypothetical protein
MLAWLWEFFLGVIGFLYALVTLVVAVVWAWVEVALGMIVLVVLFAPFVFLWESIARWMRRLRARRARR